MIPTGPVALDATAAGDIDRVLAMEAGPDTAPWLGVTGSAWHTDARRAPDVEHLLARRDGVVVGFVVLAGPRGTETGTELRRIVVATEHRGHGHGRAVLQAVLDRVAARGGRRVWLDVKPGNDRALGLYRSDGFAVEQEIGNLVILGRPV